MKEDTGIQQSDLDRFREEWLQEVKRQASAASASASASGDADKQPAAVADTPGSPKASTSAKTRLPRTARRSVDLPASAVITATANFPSVELAHAKTRNAVTVYKEAIDAETSGNLDEALVLYRKAFRLDTNVDRVYERTLQREQGQGLPTLAVGIPHSLPALVESLSLGDSTHVPPAVAQRQSVAASLSAIVSKFPLTDLAFAPEDEGKAVPIQLLPPEMVIHILSVLAETCDYTSIETFASISRKARLISLESSIWRNITGQLYKPPQIPEEVSFPELVDGYYDKDHRRALIEHPRIRYDGVYIAVCHYVRPGLSENPWVNVEHLITYHRYLRFLPDGTVLSLLANDDKPSEIVHLLRRSYRRKGFFIGSWALSGTTIILRDLIDPAGALTRYGFEMVLSLKSKPIGRWNRLELLEYSTVKLDTGEAEPLPLKHERPFWFSKVRSFKQVPNLDEDSGTDAD